MKTTPIAIHPKILYSDAFRLVHENKIRRLPVVDRNGCFSDSESRGEHSLAQKLVKEGKIKTVLICDDEAKIRQALKALLSARAIPRDDDPSPEIQVVGEARHGSEAVRMVDVLQPDVVIMDASMPGIGGVEASRLIKRKWPQVKIVILTMYPDTLPAAVEAGVDTFLLKGCLAEALFDAILN